MCPVSHRVNAKCDDKLNTTQLSNKLGLCSVVVRKFNLKRLLQTCILYVLGKNIYEWGGLYVYLIRLLLLLLFRKKRAKKLYVTNCSANNITRTVIFHLEIWTGS